MDPRQTQRLSVTLPTDLYEALHVLAAAEDRSLSWLISRAIQDFIAVKAADHPRLLHRQTSIPLAPESA